MRLSLKKFFSDAVYYGIGALFTKFIAILTLPIYTRFLTPEDYGVYSFFVAFMSVLSIIWDLGLDAAFVRYFSLSHSFEKRQYFLSTTLIAKVILSVGFCLIVLSLIPNISAMYFGRVQYISLFTLCILSVSLSSVQYTVLQVLRYDFRSRLYSVLSILLAITTTTVSLIGLLVFGLEVMALISAQFISIALFLPINIYFIRKYIILRFDKRIFKEFLAFGLPLVPSSIAWWIFSGMDRLMLGKMSDMADLGVYTVAWSLANILAILGTLFGMAWGPFSMIIYRDNGENAPKIYGDVLFFMIIIFGTLGGIVSCISYEILQIVATPPYYLASVIIGPLVLGVICNSATYITNIGPGLKKKTHFILLITFFTALVNVGLNWVLIPLWGMFGAAIASVFAYICLVIIGFIISDHLIKFVLKRTYLVSLIFLNLFFYGIMSYLSYLKVNDQIEYILFSELRFIFLSMYFVGIWFFSFGYRDVLVELCRRAVLRFRLVSIQK